MGVKRNRAKGTARASQGGGASDVRAVAGEEREERWGWLAAKRAGGEREAGCCRLAAKVSLKLLQSALLC